MARLHRKTPSDIRAQLEGPVASIPTTFTRRGDVDWPGIANMIEVALAAGSGTILLTIGDSQYFFLSPDEIHALTRFMVERTKGRALTVAATGMWSTRMGVALAKECRAIGVDVLMSLPPMDHAKDIAGLAAHFGAIARFIPVMLVGAPPLPLLDRLIDEPQVCCFKEDGSVEYATGLFQKYARHWKIMTGGVLERHLAEWPFGCTAYMDWSALFAPAVTRRYWSAIQSADAGAAAAIVREIEAPLFAAGRDYRGGWQSLWRSAIALNGVAQRYLRAPQVSATDADLARVRPLLRKIGLLG